MPSPSSFAKQGIQIHVFLSGCPEAEMHKTQLWQRQGRGGFYYHRPSSEWMYVCIEPAQHTTSKRAVAVPVTSEFDTICRNQ